MSQEGPIDILGTFPQIPTTFIADIGSAVPILNTLEILGTTQAAGTSPLHTTGSGNTITIIAQLAQANAVSSANIVGLAAFDSSSFSVDANGFVTFIGGSAGIETINGDSGSITGPIVTIYANNAALNSGSSVKFVNSGTTSTLNVTDSFHNTIMGNGSGSLTNDTHNFNNTGFGMTVLTSLDPTGVTGNQNSAFGYQSMFSNVNGNNCSAFGMNTCSNLNADNAAIFGAFSLGSATSGSDNSSFGFNCLGALLTGGFNCAMGSLAGVNYAGAESSNILIMNPGVLGESNVMRLGDQGAGSGQINSTFIAGIVGVTVANQQQVVIDSATGEMGVGSGSFAVSYTDVTFGMSPYTVLATDQYISCDTSGGAITLNFPNAPTAFQEWTVKDRTGNAAANPVTITTPGGAVTFDGATTLPLNTAYTAMNLLANATPTYEVY